MANKRRVSTQIGQTRSIDELDTRIIALLQRDAQQPNTELARKLGVTEATIRKRKQRLVEERIVVFGLWADPLRIGYQIYAVIEIQVNLPEIEAVADQLAKLPEIFILGICTGNFDIIATAFFRSSDHLHEFLTQRLARVKGIQRTVTSNLTRLVKREYASPILDGRDGSPPRPAGPPAAPRRARRAKPAAE